MVARPISTTVRSAAGASGDRSQTAEFTEKSKNASGRRKRVPGGRGVSRSRHCGRC